MLPDFLLECTTCGGEAVWDTDAVPPVGCPEVGHPVLWFCQSCGAERRHTIVDLYIAVDKLHHEICVATEVDRETVERVMAEVYRRRRKEADRLEPDQQAEVAGAVGVSLSAVERICAAEVQMLPPGYRRDDETRRR